MRYALIIYAEPGYHDVMPDAERATAHAELRASAIPAAWLGGALAARQVVQR